MRSLVHSGKKHLILTGDRGSGKSTLLREWQALLSDRPLPGLLTRAEPGCAVWMEETETGDMAQIGRYDADLPGAENKMLPCTEGFTAFGIHALARLASTDSTWVAIDEIGYLETACAPYCEAICDLMEKKRVAAVVRKQSLPFLEALKSREDVFLLDLDDPFGRIGCVIMASGEGKRFGSNKLLADFGGEPMICRVLAATEGIFSHRVVVTRHCEVERLCRERGVPVIRHDLPYRSDTVRLGVEAMAESGEAWMFCPADQPLLSRDTVQTMALSVGRREQSILRLSDGENDGAPVIFPRRCFEELKCLPQGKGGGAIMQRHPAWVHRMMADHPAELSDVDTVEDLARLLGIGKIH